MTWTYTNVPNTVQRDAVRFLCGDTDTTDQLVTDEEITYLLAVEGSTVAAAAGACEAIATKFARQADKALGPLRVSLSQKSEAYAARAKNLRTRGTLGMALAYAGGISESDKDSVEEESDRVEPAFRVRLHDEPGALNEELDEC